MYTEWMNKHLNQTFKDWNENQIQGLCDFPQREQNSPKPSCQKQLASAYGGTTMLNYCLTTSHMMISRISPGKSSAFSRCREQLQLTCLGRLFNTILSNKFQLDFSSSIFFSLWRALSRNLTHQVHGSRRKLTITPQVGELWLASVPGEEEEGGAWLRLSEMMVPLIFAEQRHSGICVHSSTGAQPTPVAPWGRREREGVRPLSMKGAFCHLPSTLHASEPNEDNTFKKTHSQKALPTSELLSIASMKNNGQL